MSNTRRTYDAEFKENAVRLVEDSGRKVSDIAESLDFGVKQQLTGTQRERVLHQKGDRWGTR